MRRLPIIPTIVVGLAAAAMVALGLWQLLIRAPQKDALIARYSQAQAQRPIVWPTAPLSDAALPLYRHATGVCLKPVATRTSVGENQSGEPGYVHIVDCATGAEGPGMSVELGWSKNPNAKFAWAGGPVSGIIAPDRKTRMRLVAASPPPGLEASAGPSLAAIPNNHRSYAFQWFAFAVTALVIYGLALRRRGGQAPRP